MLFIKYINIEAVVGMKLEIKTPQQTNSFVLTPIKDGSYLSVSDPKHGEWLTPERIEKLEYISNDICKIVPQCLASGETFTLTEIYSVLEERLRIRAITEGSIGIVSPTSFSLHSTVVDVIPTPQYVA